MNIHEFVIDKEEYNVTAGREKTFKVATDHKENHKYSEGDILFLQEADHDETRLTGRALFCVITYIQRGLDTLSQRVVLGIEPLFEIDESGTAGEKSWAAG